MLVGQTIRVRTSLGDVFVTLNGTAEGGPLEVFLQTGKSGSDAAADAQALGRLCSLLLRLPSSVPPIERIRFIIGSLAGIASSRDDPSSHARSMPDAVALALRQYLARIDVG
jgi:ribonucleoside-diphosphate reductase alpha chain